jgi:hypothetical protein
MVFWHIYQPPMHVGEAANLSCSDSMGIIPGMLVLFREKDKALAPLGYRGF